MLEPDATVIFTASMYTVTLVTLLFTVNVAELFTTIILHVWFVVIVVADETVQMPVCVSASQSGYSIVLIVTFDNCGEYSPSSVMKSKRYWKYLFCPSVMIWGDVSFWMSVKVSPTHELSSQLRAVRFNRTAPLR